MSTLTDKQNKKQPYTVRTVTDVTVQNSKGDLTWSAFGPQAYQLEIQKPAMVRNPPDATGWRKPSRYYTHPGSFGPQLFMLIEDQHFTYAPAVPSWMKNISIHSGIIGSQGLQVDFSSPPGWAPSVATLPLENIFGRITWEMEQAVRVQALASLASRKGKILETFAELRSSVRGLAANAQEINWFIDNHRDKRALQKKFKLDPKHIALKRMTKNLARTMSAAEFFGRQWLNFWFGLSPIVDEMVFVTMILSDPEMFRRIRVKGTGHRWIDTTWKGSASFSAKTGVVLPRPPLTVSYKVPLRVGVRLSAYYKVEMEALAGLKQYGLIDVASTAWALAPMSWMVDWVIPVTKILESYEALAGLSYQGATVTKYYVLGDCEATARWSRPNALWSVDTSPFKVKPAILGGKGFTRDIVLPMGMLPAPYIKDPLNLWTATTSLSYLATKMRKVMGLT